MLNGPIPIHAAQPQRRGRRAVIGLFGVVLCMLFCGQVMATEPDDVSQAHDDLETVFRTPPPAARPGTWWHWQDRITAEGIKGDLQALKGVGIGEVCLFHLGNCKDVPFGSDAWWQMLDVTLAECDRLGLRFGLHNCAGYSESGGPWITVERSMKKLVWSSRIVTGDGESLTLSPGKLPGKDYGKIQDKKVDYYRDIIVLGFPLAKLDPKLDARERWRQWRRHPIDRKDVVDLSAHLDAKTGHLDWSPPSGTWQVMRIGYRSTGSMIAPATLGGDGLECDKLDPEAVRYHLDQFVGKVVERPGAKVGEVLTFFLSDSWEAGSQDWTPGLAERFEQAHGYSLMPCMPALLDGFNLVGMDSGTFKGIWNRFLRDQLASSFFGTMHAWAREHGLKYMAEATGPQQFHTDLSYQLHNDIPMGEFWNGTHHETNSLPAIWAGHTAGRRVITAESFTGAGLGTTPFGLKESGDRILCHGVNHFTFHTSVHQPDPHYRPPGKLWVGVHFQRNNPLFPTFDGFMNYLSRCFALLQHGRPVSDVLYSKGAEPGLGPHLERSLQPETGYRYDVCGPQTLEQATVEDHHIVLPSGVRYRLLVLAGVESPASAQRIRGLVQSGGALCAHKFQRGEVHKQFGTDLFAAGGGVHQFGSGTVLSRMSPEKAITTLQPVPDFVCLPPQGNRVRFIHRQDDSADWYFVANVTAKPVIVDAAFRITGRQPEIWNPETGSITVPAEMRTDGKRTIVPLRLERSGSLFVVFRRPLPPDHVTATEISVAHAGEPLWPACRWVRRDGGLAALVTVNGSYSATLADGGNVTAKIDDIPAPIALPGKLEVIPAVNSRVRGRLQTTFAHPAEQRAPGSEWWLDLGQIEGHVVVVLNDERLRTLWKPPFRIRVDHLLRDQNTLEIEIHAPWHGNKKGGETSAAKLLRGPILLRPLRMVPFGE